MLNLEQDILRILNKAKEEIRSNMASKGINASGRTSRGFEVEKYEGGFRLVLKHDAHASVECKPRGFGSVQVGVAPLSTLEIGRTGGRVPRGFYYIIKQWTRDKGLQFGSESERQTFSYFVSQKIMREGTKRNRKHEVIYSQVAKNAREELERDLRTSIQGVIIDTAKSNI